MGSGLHLPHRRSDLAVREAAFLEVSLVIVLGAPERRERRDLGDDRTAIAPAGLLPLAGSRGRFLLRGIVEEDRGSVLRPDVRTLPVLGGWIVIFPEHVEQPVVGDLFRIELDLDGLRVPRAIGADVLVSRVRPAAAGISDRRVEHARHLAERRLDPPETPGGESGFLAHSRGLPSSSANTPGDLSRFPRRYSTTFASGKCAGS